MNSTASHLEKNSGTAPATLWKSGRTAILLVGFFVAWVALLHAMPSEPPKTAPKAAVARMWRGKVPVEKADEYEKYLNESGVKKLRTIKNNLGVQMFRRDLKDATEFVVISYWPNREAIKAYAGDDIDKVRHLPKDKDYLIDPEDTVRHYDVKADEWEK